MAVESNEATAIARIAMLCYWVKSLQPVFNQREAKPKPIAPCMRDFSHTFGQLQVISRNSDWFIALFAPPE